MNYDKIKFNTYVADVDLKGSILCQNPVPSSVDHPSVLNEFLTYDLEEQNSSSTMRCDEARKKEQTKVM